MSQNTKLLFTRPFILAINRLNRPVFVGRWVFDGA